jgi:hypothetical protein
MSGWRGWWRAARVSLRDVATTFLPKTVNLTKDILGNETI